MVNNHWVTNMIIYARQWPIQKYSSNTIESYNCSTFFFPNRANIVIEHILSSRMHRVNLTLTLARIWLRNDTQVKVRECFA